MNESPRILLLGHVREGSLVRDLISRGFTISTTEGDQHALDELVRSHFDVIVVDLVRTDGGIEFIKRVKAVATLRQIPILVVGEWGTGLPSLALSMGADACEPAPINSDRLFESVRRLLYRRAAAAGAGK